MRFFSTLAGFLALTVFGVMTSWSATPQPEKATPATTTANSTNTTKATPAASPAKTSATKLKKSAVLDKKTVEELYHGGDFDQLIALLENMRRDRRIRDKEDSIFIYKYLGVVYGADMGTRRKAESFLYQMLKLDPRQDLEDLEVGDAILDMFREVRKRYDRTASDSDSVAERERVRKNLKTFGYPIDSTGRNLIEVRPDTGANAVIGSAGAKTSDPASQAGGNAAATSGDGKGNKTWLWVAGGAAAVTLVGITTIMLMSDPGTQTTTVVTKVK